MGDECHREGDDREDGWHCGSEVECLRRDTGDHGSDDRVDDRHHAGGGEDGVKVLRRWRIRGIRSIQAAVIVVGAGDEVPLDGRRGLDVGVPNAVHALEPARVFAIQVHEPHESDDADE